MATIEVIDVVSLVIGVVGVFIGARVTLRTLSLEKNTRHLLLVMAVLLIVALIVFISVSAELLLSVTTLFTRVIMFTSALFAVLVGLFAFQQIVGQQSLIVHDKKRDQDRRSTLEVYDAEMPKCLKDYKNATLRDATYTTIQTAEMNTPLDMDDAYIELKLLRYDVEHYHDKAKHSKWHTPKNSLLMESKQLDYVENNGPQYPLQVVSNHQYCVIVGDPGSGKTTLLKNLVLQTSNAQCRFLPIFINLNEFARSNNPDLFNFVLKKWAEAYDLLLEETSSYVNKFIELGRVLLLLDGLDETFIGEEPEKHYNRVVKIIEETAKAHRKLHIVVTVRRATYYQQTMLSFKHSTIWEVRPFGWDDIRKFVSNQFTNKLEASPRNVHHLTMLLEKSGRMQRLAQNPLFLLFIVLTYQRGDDPAERQAALYEQYVESILIGWDASRAIERSTLIDVEDTRKLFNYIAFQFHEKQLWEVEEEEVIATINKAKIIIPSLNQHDSKLILDIITTESGILTKNSSGKYEFLYGPFQEYFTAKYLAQKSTSEKMGEILYNFWWKDVVVLYAAYAKKTDAELLWTILLNREKRVNVFFSVNLLLAGYCLAARTSTGNANGVASDLTDETLPGEIIQRLFSVLEGTRYSRTRNEIAKALTEIGSPTIIAKLKEYFKLEIGDSLAGNAHICQSIVKALGEIGERNLNEGLFSLLCKYPTLQPKELREHIARTLGKTAGKDLIDAMIQELADSSNNFFLRLSMAQALSETRMLSVAEILLDILSNNLNDDVDILYATLMALIETGESSLALKLVSLLSKKAFYHDVAKGIAEVLGKLGQGNEEVAQNLVKLLPDKELDVIVRCRIASALGDLGIETTQAVLAQLQELYKNAEIETTLRYYISITLCRLGDYSVVSDLLILLEDMKRRAELTHRDSNDTARAPNNAEVQTNINSTNINLMQEIVMALAQIKGSIESHDISSLLLRILQDKNMYWQVRKSAATALGKREEDEQTIVKKLLPLLEKSDLDEESDGVIHTELRERIAESVGNSGKPTNIPKLLDLLEDKTIPAKVRERIAYAIKLLTRSDEDKDSLKDSAKKLAALLNDAEVNGDADLRDSIHSALWEVSQRLPDMLVVERNGGVEVIPASEVLAASTTAH